MIKLLIILFYTGAVVESSNKRGVPVPGAEILDSLLSKFLNKDSTGALLEYLKDGKSIHTDNLDIDILDAHNVRKLIKKAFRMQNEKDQASKRPKEKQPKQNIRRVYNDEAKYYSDYPTSNATNHAFLHVMRQAIYATRYRMQDTKKFRKYFANDVSFNIAIFYGALMKISLKLQTLFAIMRKFFPKTHFLFYLTIYEKMLAANVDCHDMVERIFYLHNIYIKAEDGVVAEIAPTIPLPTKKTHRPKYRRRTTKRRTPPPVSMPPGITETDYDEGTEPGVYLGTHSRATTLNPADGDDRYSTTETTILDNVTDVENITRVTSNVTEETPESQGNETEASAGTDITDPVTGSDATDQSVATIQPDATMQPAATGQSGATTELQYTSPTASATRSKKGKKTKKKRKRTETPKTGLRQLPINMLNRRKRWPQYRSPPGTAKRHSIRTNRYGATPIWRNYMFKRNNKQLHRQTGLVNRNTNQNSRTQRQASPARRQNNMPKRGGSRNGRLQPIRPKLG